MTTKDDREAFLSRWSRLKSEAREDSDRKELEKTEESKPAPELPPVEDLNYDSDFSAFMDKRVDQKLRRLALKKLFQDPHFNIPDGLDDFAEDFTLLEDLPEDMVALQQHARRVLFGPEGGEKSAVESPADAHPEERSADQIVAGSGEAMQPQDAGDVRAGEDKAEDDPDGNEERGQG